MHFTCPRGFNLTGASVLSCLHDGEWNDTTPSCIPRHCPTPNNTNQHRSSSTNHTVSSTTTFQCDTGYESNNSLSVYCHYNQSWSSIFPTCTPVKCPQVVNGTGVSIAYPVKAHFNGESLNSSCVEGYDYVSGDAIRQCENTGSWSGNEYVCKRVTCPSLSAPASGTLNSTEGFKYEATAYFSCAAGYELSGSNRSDITCMSSGKWSGRPPMCTCK